MLAAAPSYLALYGTPKTIEDLRNIVLPCSSRTRPKPGSAERAVSRGFALSDLVKFSTNNSTALLWAILKGAGIGWSPTYIHVMGPKMVPLDIDAIFPFDIWLTYHPDAARVPRVRRLIDWIIENFDPKVFPWFRDEFIHPRDLPAFIKARRWSICSRGSPGTRYLHAMRLEREYDHVTDVAAAAQGLRSVYTERADRSARSPRKPPKTMIAPHKASRFRIRQHRECPE